MTISAIKPLLPATCVAIALAYASVNPAGKKPPIHVQILSFNDFHGHISAGLTIDGRAAGSAPVLWAYLRDEQKRFDGETFFVHAGDLIGGSIPQSALLQDEPAVMLLNTLVKRRFGRPLRADHPANNVICTPGNHEFDEGTDELLRIMKGGNHANGPFLENPWRGAAFSSVVANVIMKSNNRSLLAPYAVRRVKGTRIAFIGAVLKETPFMVTPSAIAEVDFIDEAEAINRAVRELKDREIRAIVVVIHQGGSQDAYEGPTRRGAPPVSGPIAAIVNQLDGEVDAVITGHTHSFINALLPSRDGKEILVTQAGAKGCCYGDMELEIDRQTGDITGKSAHIVTAWADTGFHLEPDSEAKRIVDYTEQKVAPLVDRVIAKAACDIRADRNEAGESALGNLIADAQRAITGTDFSLTNPGGIRADCDSGAVTWGELCTMQPFNNLLVKMELTGRQLYRVLNQQWIDESAPQMLQISGFTYTWDNSRPHDDRIVEIQKNGIAVDTAARYSITVNGFLAQGGDHFSVFTEGTTKIIGPTDLEALVTYISQLRQPFSATIEGRIQMVR